MLSDAFAVASANGAEYSILSELSLVCGNTDISAAYALRSSKRDTTAYDFAKKATLVIVDLGAADYALSKTNSSVTAKAFAEKYKALIETIIDKNGTANAPCRVVCIYDSANGDFARAVTDVYAELGRQEAGIYTCQRISGDDGVMSNTEQADFMKRLQAVIELAKAGSITDRPMNSTENGNGMDVSYKDFVEVTVQKYTNISLTPTTAGVRLLGVRNLDSTTGVNCDWSCSGIEVSIAHSGGDVMFSVTGNNSQFRVWVDGVEWKNADGSLYYVFGSEGSSRITVPDVPMGTHTIRVVKVTSIDRARNQITSISLKGELRDTVAAPSELYIEYIGDSISCGWGVVGNYDGDYKSMDGTLAMPYMISQELGADYSVTAVSGRGVIYGDHAIPQSYLLAAPFKNDTESGMYDFARKADIVVVNIGTNDYTYKVDRAEFEAAYKALLDTIKEKNGADCKIVCVYNAMNDTCSENLLAACAAAGGEAAGIYTLKLAKASNPHSSALGHPTVEDNQKNAKAIIDFMELKNII